MSSLYKIFNYDSWYFSEATASSVKKEQCDFSSQPQQYHAMSPIVYKEHQTPDSTVKLVTTVSGTGVGSVGAAVGGVAMGAAIGSVVPGIGTLIGGAIGGIAGGIGGATGT